MEKSLMVLTHFYEFLIFCIGLQLLVSSTSGLLGQSPCHVMSCVSPWWCVQASVRSARGRTDRHTYRQKNRQASRFSQSQECWVFPHCSPHPLNPPVVPKSLVCQFIYYCQIRFKKRRQKEFCGRGIQKGSACLVPDSSEHSYPSIERMCPRSHT